MKNEEVKRVYNPALKEMGYITPRRDDCRDLFFGDLGKMNAFILEDFYAAVDWLRSRQYEEYTELASNTLNPAQQNAFIPLREYRVKRNGHIKHVAIFHRFSGGCFIEETAY